MHTTTVRFADDTWHEVKAEAERAGIPVAQYIREATIARLAAGRVVMDDADLKQRVRLLEAQVGRLVSRRSV